MNFIEAQSAKQSVVNQLRFRSSMPRFPMLVVFDTICFPAESFKSSMTFSGLEVGALHVKFWQMKAVPWSFCNNMMSDSKCWQIEDRPEVQRSVKKFDDLSAAANILQCLSFPFPWKEEAPIRQWGFRTKKNKKATSILQQILRGMLQIG